MSLTSSTPTRTVLVGVDFGREDIDASMAELVLLAKSAGADIVESLVFKRHSAEAAQFIGTGQAETLARTVAATAADLVIFNHSLAPTQQRNLENTVRQRVLDRNGLILDIFALRAQSFEGKLQVELAQLQHLSTRLVRAWTHLERQKGGIGLRGPGETQLELDKRMIGDKVRRLKAQLVTLEQQRKTQRRQRERRGMFTVSLVGYTNAGKSSLFNALAHGQAYCADQLFATLDTTTRRVYVGDGVSLALSDTVGFIRDLPHQLVAAFKSTLEQTLQADLLLHVVDASSPERHTQIAQVEAVLRELGAEQRPQWLVWNKIDATDRQASVQVDDGGNIRALSVSARTGDGVDQLRQALVEIVRNRQTQVVAGGDGG